MRWLVLYQQMGGDVLGRFHIIEAPSVSKALQAGPPRDHRVHSAVVLPLAGDGKRVPIHHRSPSWAPSSEWEEVKP